MSSSTARSWLGVAGVAAGGAAVATVLGLANAPVAAQAALVALAVGAGAVLAERRAMSMRARLRNHAEQGALFDHMLHAIDTERETLAHCLHDGPQQTMTAVRLMCDVV